MSDPTRNEGEAMSDHPVIAPEDIRPGDVVWIVREVEVWRPDEKVIHDTAGMPWSTGSATIHLIHRPDPDAEAVEALRRAHRLTTASDDYATTIKTLREQGWDVTRRQNGQEHA